MATEIVSLYVLRHYLARNIEYLAGTTIQVDPDTAAFLQRDAPGCFAHTGTVNNISAHLESPPENKMIGRPRKTKGLG